MVDTSVGDPDQGADSSNAVPEGTQHTQEWKLAIEREEKKGTKGVKPKFVKITRRYMGSQTIFDTESLMILLRKTIFSSI